ncbi:hypothetical protein CIB95_11950 [Lottiidibacillus patelloidae]|uniref:Uncharacterized protein n=1 Tax=Lottiidibacillus patelloidae TaxID=2670334 RepID=A0A263BSD2_9BACI|nr:hypothetical protein [Lottiidibacillus patelloidae]OZM56482.1 hypothetical protein CIB95_11950 [Lottiidibacillus patelloidae]
MKRPLLLANIIGLIAILLLGIYFNMHFHTSDKGAQQEFIESWDGTIISKFISIDEHSRAFAIDESGTIFVALNNSYQLPFGNIYTDYTLYETSLNIHELPEKAEYYYTEIQHNDKPFHLLLLSNDEVFTKVINRENIARIGISGAEKYLINKDQSSPIQLYLLGFWDHDNMTNPKEQIFLSSDGEQKEIVLKAIKKD